MDQVNQLLKELKKQTLREELIDRFLDLYVAWRRSNSLLIETQLTQLAKQLELLDPDFHFTMVEKGEKMAA